MDWLLVIKRS